MMQACFADVDRSNLGIRLAKRITGRLGRAAASDQYLLVGTRPLGWPHKVEQRSATLRITVKSAVFIQACKRCRVRHSLVEVADLFRAGCPHSCFAFMAQSLIFIQRSALHDLPMPLRVLELQALRE